MKTSVRIGLVHGALLVFAVLLVGRAAQVQLLQRELWASQAERQQVGGATLPAPRGAILDANGDVLAESREVVQLAVAPREVRDLAALRRALTEAGIAAATVRRATDTSYRWVELRYRFLPEQAAPLLAMRGVHGSPALERVSPAAEGARRIIGVVDADGHAVDGIELALDSVLRGTQGRNRFVRDAHGGSFESPAVDNDEPLPGSTVVLTLNHSLQDIAEHSLEVAVERAGASGGDVVVLDPRNGDILALVSQREGRSVSGVPALTDTYEPGSTIKPFLAARLLELGRTRPDEIVDVHGGSYMAPGRRTPIRDVHRADTMSMADVLRYSSNVGAVVLAERLSPREQYEALRDFGFGVSTGVAFPTEASGTLPRPERWSLTTPAALAMGYEVGVTPLQLANAYASIANGGRLLEPSLIKEVRDPEGRVTYRRTPREVRRVMPESVAATLRALLAAVVDSGTATSATLTTYEVGGKSGTARLNTGRGYEGGAYTASFVALFPAEAPQLVVLVKLDRPRGVYYGGAAAGPVSKAVLEAALAARDAALDRGELVQRARVGATRRPSEPTRLLAAGHRAATGRTTASAGEAAPPEADLAGLGNDSPGLALAQPVLFDLTVDPPPAPAAAAGLRTVPDVSGLPLRAAVRLLHGAGFRVRLVSGVSGTVPEAGVQAPVGSAVRLGAAR